MRVENRYPRAEDSGLSRARRYTANVPSARFQASSVAASDKICSMYRAALISSEGRLITVTETSAGVTRAREKEIESRRGR